jgi:hypothetical protein
MATKGIMAMIIPIESGSGARPDNTLPGQQPRPDNTLPGAQPGIDNTLPGALPRPEHPIYYPLPPGAPVDPSYGVPEDGPYPDQGLPGSQPRPDNTLPGSQPKPDQGLPGSQPKPSHPIALPPDSGGWEPVFIWGPTDPRPGTGLPGSQPGVDNTLPIPVPPEGETDDGQKIKYVPIWTPKTGWVTVGIVLPEGPTATPSSKRK